MPDAQPKPTAAEVLRQHTNIGDYACGCGWEHAEDPQWPDIEAHQEDMLAAAGLLATGECARCGRPVILPPDDPTNSALRVCHECEAEMHREWLPEHDAQVAAGALRAESRRWRAQADGWDQRSTEVTRIGDQYGARRQAERCREVADSLHEIADRIAAGDTAP